MASKTKTPTDKFCHPHGTTADHASSPESNRSLQAAGRHARRPGGRLRGSGTYKTSSGAPKTGHLAPIHGHTGHKM